MVFLRNTWLMWAAFGCILVGFLLLTKGRLSWGPLLLVAGYCLLLPFFLWRTFRRSVGDA